jgi:hypothetical protein
MSDEYQEIQAVIVGQTDLAVLLEFGVGERHWVPKSVVDFEQSEATDVGERGIVAVKTWFCRRNGIQ